MREHHHAHSSTSTNAPSNPQKQDLRRVRKCSRRASVEVGKAALKWAEERTGHDGKGRCVGERVEEHVRVQCGREGAVGVGRLGAGEAREGKRGLARLLTYTARHMRRLLRPRPEHAPPC